MNPAKTGAKRVKNRIVKPRDGEGSRDERSQTRHFSAVGAKAAKNGAELPFAKAAFALSVHDPRQLPPPTGFEIAFVGRSNAGKSSAINALAGRRRLAFMSKTPGRTQLINFFALAGVVVVMDVRHPLTPLDLRLLDWLRDAGRPVHILLTKSDKLSKQAAQATLARVKRELAQLYPGATAQLFSSLKREGIEEAASALARLAVRKKQSPG
jgi:GTP-binding protein